MTRRWRTMATHPAHADDWLMTYADVITLLLCFFAASLAISIHKRDIPPRAQTPPVIAQAVVVRPVFKTDLFEGNLPFHLPQQAMAPLRAEDDGGVPATATPASAAPAAQTQPAPPARLQPVSAPVATLAASPAAVSPPPIADRLQAPGSAPIAQAGDRLTTLQMSSEAFFASGSATLSESGKLILQSVAANLKADKFSGYEITVEGHTDDTPIDTAQFPSNWELSTARASAVVHFFLEQGISAQRLRAAGYADTFPIAPNRDAMGRAIPENQAKNRRVVIKLEKIEKAG